MDYEGGRVVVLVIQDRKGVKYSIKNPYSEKVRFITYAITAPEVEMLMIHSLGYYEDYKKQKTKTETKHIPFKQDKDKNGNNQIKRVHTGFLA